MQLIRKSFICMHIYFLLLLSLAPCFAQVRENYISGKITDGATGKPIPGCSVYFSNTSKGDISTASGEFVLKNLPAGKYQLVISAIGYETKVMLVSSNNYPHKLEVQLRVHASQLSEVTVQPSLINGWAKWGQVFLDNFIGTIPNASYCRLTNHDVIKFWFSEKNNRLTAHADEPLIIENAALGYIIKFKLEEFTLDFNSQLLVYNGYPLFQEMTASNVKKQNKWKENRELAYYGSLLDFMRCLYHDRWLQAGYHIVTYQKRLNTEKQRVRKLLDAGTPVHAGDSVNSKSSTAGMPVLRKDTNAYYKKILKQPDSLSEYVSLTDLDSMLVQGEDGSKIFFFENKLEIVYKRYPQSKSQQQSEIYLRTPDAIQIEENGSYFSPKELVSAFHWGEYEKVANLLPFDYEP